MPDLKAILRLEVPIIVEIGSRAMSVDAVLALAPGSIIELPKAIEDELEIKVNNKPVGLGNAVKVGENFGIRVSYVGDVKARIEALADRRQFGAHRADDADELNSQFLRS